MRWWKRLIFSIISLFWGAVSLDYLIFAFQMLTASREAKALYSPKSDGLYQLLGFGMFLLWFIIVAFYFFMIRKSSIQIDLIEKDAKRGDEKIKKKWFDMAFQIALILTGMLLRWCYLIFIYLPNL